MNLETGSKINKLHMSKISLRAVSNWFLIGFKAKTTKLRYTSTVAKFSLLKITKLKCS